MTDSMAELIAKRYIQRRDVKAAQKPNGDYVPVAHWNADGSRGAPVPWRMADIADHLNGVRTYGHYLLDQDDNCKLFAFDIDLEANRAADSHGPGFTGSYCVLPDMTNAADDIPEDQYRSMVQVIECDPRNDWMNRAHPARPWMKMQLRTVASLLARTIYEELEIPVATAYSGSKGLHVYGFTGTIPAAAAREAAEMVLQLTGRFKPLKGAHFFRAKDDDPFTGCPNVSVEVFPKQTTLAGKDLGNLMRLPLGRNLKSPDPAFFIDERITSMTTIAPHPDPIALLQSGNPWRD